MNYHLFTDHWFVDDFIRTATIVAPGLNRFIVTSEGPAKHVKSEQGERVPYGSDEMKRIIRSIGAADSVYVHWFSPSVMEVIRAIPSSTRVYLIFWGGDFLSFTERFDRMNYDPMTAAHLKSQKSGAILQFIKSPFKEFRNMRTRQAHQQSEIRVRREFMSRLNYFCHWNKRDMELVTAEFGGQPTFLHFYYGGGLSDIPGPAKRPDSTGSLNIWLGNSDTPANNHLDALHLLQKYQSEDIQIMCPLSYGFGSYGEVVDQSGLATFGQKWKSFRRLVPLKEYLAIQQDVNVVVMHHNRSQASGNIIAFLKMGKKLFLKRQSSIFDLIADYGIKVFDANKIGSISFEEFAEPLTEEEVERNSTLITAMFSEEGKIEGFKRILLRTN